MKPTRNKPVKARSAARKPRAVRQGTAKILQGELASARSNLRAHEHDAGRPYCLGVVDGLVLAMGVMHIPTSPEEPAPTVANPVGAKVSLEAAAKWLAITNLGGPFFARPAEGDHFRPAGSEWLASRCGNVPTTEEGLHKFYEMERQSADSDQHIEAMESERKCFLRELKRLQKAGKLETDIWNKSLFRELGMRMA